LKKTGFTFLPLHGGHAPNWLISRMKKLADEIIWAVVDEYGSLEVLRRMSNPFWFQAFGCILGFDWHSSGLTTVVTGVLKGTLTYEKHGIMVAGGKGIASRKSLQEIQELGDKYNYSSKKIEEFQYASRMTAKVDNTAIQAGYPLYHHTFFLLFLFGCNPIT
jgi:hypothetical protein